MNHTSTDSTDDHEKDVEAIALLCVVFAIILCTIIACKKLQNKFQTDMQRHAQVFGRNPRQFTLSV